MTQLGLLAWSPPKAKEDAPDGVKRAARCGAGIDPAVLAVAREYVGREVTEGDFWAFVDRRVSCGPDSARRRRDGLQKQGLLAYERPSLGVIRILWVKA